MDVEEIGKVKSKITEENKVTRGGCNREDVTSHYPRVTAARTKSDSGGMLRSPSNLFLR